TINPGGSDTDRQALAEAQEWWAQYDRHRLARDIYTLLYLLGHGDDSLNLRTQGYPATPDENSNSRNDHLEEMAQFAVNVVDALDRDDVITKFEYDLDLTDGWNPAETDVVYGVEAQSLTLSEVMWIQSQDSGSDESS